MASTFFVLFLLSLVTVQFLVILHLGLTIKTIENEKEATRVVTRDMCKAFIPPPCPLAIDANRALSSNSKECKCDNIGAISKVPQPISLSSSESKIEGVAVTLFLHSPTWFQRRFTMMVFNVYNNLPPNWRIQIFYTGMGQSQNAIDINRGLKRLIDNGKVILTLIPKSVLDVKKKAFELMTESWIWENMLADKVFTFGGNQVICSNSPYTISDFLDYDYLGSPWDSFKGVGGDGGISLRNRKLMLKAIEYELSKFQDEKKRKTAYKNWGQEDHFFVSRLLEMNKKKLLDPPAKLAPREVTLRFSAIGSAANESVLVASGTLPVLSNDERNKFMLTCPELKVLYPALHDPSCFGAAPNAEKCAKSICALEVPKRKGGC